MRGVIVGGIAESGSWGGIPGMVLPGLFMGQDVFENLTGRVGPIRVVGSGQEVLKFSRFGSGHSYPTRPGPTHDVCPEP